MEYLTRYAQSILDKYQYVQLWNLPPIPLMDLYVPPNVREDHYEESVEFYDFDFMLDLAVNSDNHPLHSVLDVVDDPEMRFLEITGGCGKSLLLKYLAVRWASQSTAKGAAPNVPILIDLAEFTRAGMKMNEEGIGEFLQRVHGLQPESSADILRMPGTLFLFDGFEDLSEDGRTVMTAAISDLARGYPHARRFVRTTLFSPEARSRSFRLQSFDDSQINDYVNKFTNCVYRDPQEREIHRSRMMAMIDDMVLPQRAEVDPLILSTMAVADCSQPLPRRRGDLFRLCIPLLLRRWDVSLDEEGRWDALRRGSTLQPERVSKLGFDDALKEVLVGVPELDRVLPWVRATICIRYQKCSMDDNSVSDYCRALPFAEAFERDKSLQELKRDFCGGYWTAKNQELLPILAGLLPPDTVGQIIRELLQEKPVSDSDERYNPPILLAAQCLAEVRGERGFEDLEREILKRVTALTRHSGNLGPGRARLGAMSHNSGSLGEGAARAIYLSAQMWRNEPWMRKWLFKNAQNENWSVSVVCMGALIARWGDDEDVVRLVKKTLAEDANLLLCTSVRTLLRRKKQDPEILPLLKKIIGQGRPKDVRQEALKLVVQMLDGKPARREFLREQYRHHVDLHPAIIKYFVDCKDKPETLSMLKGLVRAGIEAEKLPLSRETRKDEVVEAAGVSLRALVWEWKDDPETLPMVKEMVRSAREGAHFLETLAREWPDDPETLPTLRRYLSEKDPDGLAAALQESTFTARQKENNERFYVLESYAKKRAVAIWELTRLGQGQDLFPVLKEGALQGENWDLQEVCIQVLADHWRGHPDTLSVIKQAAAGYFHVRLAFEKWHETWPDDPEFKDALHTALMSIQEYRGNYELLEFLQRIEGADATPLLKEIALTHEDPDMRQSALALMSMSNEPDALDFVYTQQDKDGKLREEEQKKDRRKELRRQLLHLPLYPIDILVGIGRGLVYRWRWGRDGR